MNGDAEDRANKQYTIFIPGMKDVIAYPDTSAEGKEQKRIRIQRMRSQYSPVPEKLRWIPQVINYIDDAQDIFITALTLGKFLLPRVMARFIPYVGWALLINDILNLGTAILSVTQTGPTAKTLARASIRALLGNRFRRIKYAQKWMQRKDYLPFVIQAAQASETLTGYGLRLGPIMGTVSNTFWGVIRSAQGAQVRVVGPPSPDPVAKAARYLSQSYMKTQFWDELSADDLALANNAEALAMRILFDHASSNVIEKRADDMADTQVAVFNPWNEASRAALAEEGIDPDGNHRVFYKGTEEIPTYQQAIRQAANYQKRYEMKRAIYYQYEDEGAIQQLIQHQAGEDAWDWLNGKTGSTEEVWDNLNIVLTKAIEFGVFPPEGTPGWKIRYWLSSVANRVAWAIGEYPTRELLIEVAVETLGGYRTTPPPGGYAPYTTAPKTIRNYYGWY